MDIWENVIVAYSSFKSIDNFKKAVASAQNVLATELTEFETDWFVYTLLYHPVQLLDTLGEKQGDPEWAEYFAGALSLLADLIQTHTRLHQYYHQIVQVCSLLLDGAHRTPALNCLLHTSLYSAAPANLLERLVAAFESPRAPSRGPLGLLIGSICRSRPQVVEQQGERLWRVFLQVLDDGQLSGTARAAVLEGASGVLSACGSELPTADLLVFYNLLRTTVLHPRCYTVCMRILSRHVALFRERATEDVALRTRLWEQGGEPVNRALSAIYREMARDPPLYATLTAEVLKYATASQAATRIVALRALRDLSTNSSEAPIKYVHVPKLECKLRADHVQSDDVSLIAWCIESGLPGSHELVRAWMQRNDLLASWEQQITQALLDAPYFLRKWAIHVMVTESCQSSGLRRCMAICEDLFHTENKEEPDPSDEAKVEMLDELVEEILTVVRAHPTNCREKDCQSIAGVCGLACVALRSGSSGAAVAGARLVGALSSCGVRHPAVLPAALSAALAAPLAPIPLELKMLRVESLRDAEAQWQCCEVVCSSAKAPPRFLANFTLAAADIILSSGRADATLLCACVRTLAALVRTHRDTLDKPSFSDVCKRISGLPARRVARSRVERELRREILLFLGQCPLQTSDFWIDHAIPVPITVGMGLNIASALEAATLGPSWKVETAQGVADWLSEALRERPSVDPPMSILIWLASSGVDLLPFAGIFPQRALPKLFQSVEHERSAVTRSALAALATAALAALSAEDREMQLRVLLSQQDAAVGRLEMLAAASRASRNDNISLRHEILGSLAANGGLHLASSLVPETSAAAVLTSLLSVPLPAGTAPLVDGLALECLADAADRVVEAISESCSFSRLVNVLNELDDSPGLSRRVCMAEGQMVPRKLFALGCADAKFIAGNADVLMEIDAEATIEAVCTLIENVNISSVRTIRSHLADCVKRLTIISNSVAVKLYKAGEKWLAKHKLWEITNELRQHEFRTERWEVVKAIRDMIKANALKPAMVGEAVNWAKAVREIYDAGLARHAPHTPYLIDVLRVAVPALNMTEFQELFHDDLEFCKWAIPALEYLENETERLLTLKCLAELLPLFRKTRIELVDKLWPDFERNSTFEEKVEVALAIGAGEAVLWAEKAVNANPPPLQTLRLLPLLPSTVQRRVASSALAAAGVIGAGGVASAKEGVAVAAVRALLASPPSVQLVQIVATLADDETECDWFEAALLQWARNASATECAADILTQLYELCWDARTLGILRLMVPMLRSINASLLEELTSEWANRLIGFLRVKPRPGGDRRAMTRCLNDYVRALTLLTVAFERVPRSHHERADAVLHQALPPQPFQLVRMACTLCVALRESVRACDDLRELFRVFECANFTCLSAALFCRQGPPSTFRAVLDETLWQRLVPASVSLPISTYSRNQATSTLQSRVFLSTLTDDPLLYDLHEEVVQSEISEAKVSGKLGGSTNSHGWDHECARTLCALVRYSVRTLPPDLYLTPLRAALTSRTCTLRWLLAQAVCDEPTLIDTLRDDLLAVILDTLENRSLNRLHLHILAVMKPVPLGGAIGILSALVVTAVELESRSRLLIETLERWSRVNSGVVLPSTCYSQYLIDPGWKRWSCISVMKRVCSYGIRVSGLPLELGRLAVAAANDVRSVRSIGAALGGALAAEADAACDEAARRAATAVRKEGGAGAYLTLFAAAASVYPAFVNADHARIVTDMATKIIGRDKQKCLRILCAYARSATEQSNEQIADIFDLIEQTVSLTCDPLILDLCTAGLTYAREAARERVVAVAVQLATPTTLATPNLQRAAYLLLFAEIARRVNAEREARKEAEPPSKRRAGCVYSPILSAWDDMAWRGVLNSTFTALDHKDTTIAKGAMQALSHALTVDDQYTRLSEIIHLCSFGSRGVLRLFLSDIVDKSADRERSVLESLLSAADYSETVACALAASIAQTASGTASEREKLITLAENHCGSPVTLELLHCLVPAGRQVQYAGDVRDPVLRELRRRATLASDDHYTLGNSERCFRMSEEFSIEAMSKCFGWLCEWERWGEWGENVEIPQLWSDAASFRREMESYTGEGWLCAVYSGLQPEEEPGLYRLLLASDSWPRDTFALSAIWELEMWKEGEFVRENVWLDAGEHACLAQTAALLMTRSLRLQSPEHCEEKVALHKNMVEWCSLVNSVRGASEALRIALFGDVIRVCNQLDLETVGRGVELVTAKRGLALLRNSAPDLAETLSFAEQKLHELSESESLEALRLMQLVLKLRSDTNDVSRALVDDALIRIKQFRSKDEFETRSVIASVAVHLDCLFERTIDVEERNDILNRVYEAIELSGGVRRAGSIVDMLLARLLTLPKENRPQTLLHKLSQASEDLEGYQREAAIECGVTLAEAENEWGPRLALVRDPQHALLHSCAMLLRAAASEDLERWCEALRCARVSYPDTFVALPDGEISEGAVRTVKTVQKTAQAQLDARGDGALRLSTLSPALAASLSESTSLASQLGLARHLRVHRFEEKIEVFADSARRPCVLRARLTNGSMRRWLVKAESPRADCAAMAVAHALRRMHPSRGHHLVGYVVQALTTDCSLIEFLEEHKRLDELASSASAVTLRESIRKRSVTAQHFLEQQRRFSESLAAGTVLSGLLGVGDRHPQNVVVGVACAVVHVDWASAPRHDALVREPAPVRLTPNMLALATTGLESLILEWSEVVREHAAELVATLRIVYRYLPDSQLYKVEMTEQLVRGERTIHELALQQLQLQRQWGSLGSLLADVFRDFPRKEIYSVQEQVSSLLWMSTDSRILALTRPAWQPKL